MSYSLRQKVGALVFDAPRYCAQLAQNKWLNAKNRDDTFSTAPDGPGLKCEWQWTSNLHLPKVFPWFGKQLFRVTLSNCKFKLSKSVDEAKPQVSVIIGHRGKPRTPQLLKTLESIAAQENCALECIVVEQDNEPHLATLLPAWVQHIVTPLPDVDMPYSRAWAFNVGAQHAQADCLIFHDNDLLMSSRYAYETLRRFQQGYEFINLKRFIFYLSEGATEQVLNGASISSQLCLETIMQNAEGGGSIGASRKAYFAIGGFDERFVGWGGEDIEFWERASTRNIWPYTYLPLVHLWHPSQAEKSTHKGLDEGHVFWTLQAQSPVERIEHLTSDLQTSK